MHDRCKRGRRAREIAYIEKRRENERERREKIQSGQRMRARACRGRHVAYTCSGFSWSHLHSSATLSTLFTLLTHARVHSHGFGADTTARQDNARTLEEGRRSGSWWSSSGAAHSTGDLAALSTPFLLARRRGGRSPIKELEQLRNSLRLPSTAEQGYPMERKEYAAPGPTRESSFNRCFSSSRTNSPRESPGRVATEDSTE